ENVAHYNVYFGTTSGEYDSTHQVTLPADTLRGLTENTTYFVTVTAINADDYESIGKKEVSATTYHFTLDQGILLVDETYDQTLSYNFVNGDSINAFYNRALQGYTYTYSDHSCPNCYPQNQLHISDLLHYSPVIVHSEDNRGNHSLGDSNDSTYLVLREYLKNGGKLIIEGRRNLSTGNDGDPAIRQFLPSEIQYDYLKVKSAYVPPWSSSNRSEEFIGAFSQIPDYPDLQVDSLRVEQCSGGINPPLAGKVPGVGYIDSLLTGEVVYRFNSAYDTSGSEEKAVAFRYLGSDYQVIFLDFPLYFIHEAQACSLLHRALSDLGTYPSAVAEEESSVPLTFSMKQNFPNPFNSETVIEYSLPRESQIKITIYNLLGQKVKTLINGKSPAGRQEVSWDGKNNRGEAVSSGIYFYRMEADEFTQIKKMVFLK
ncbi:MAG: FlgD immunoglobulin-like domain containing protein, partial [Candidatus Zixiibacteriota bacterium]